MKRLITLLFATAIVFGCKESAKTDGTEILLSDNSFNAVPMPSKLITGNPFPTDSTTINNWVANSMTVANLETNTDIINHGWAIWQSLTEPTDQINNGQAMRRFETWYTPNDIIAAYNLKEVHPKAKLHHVQRSTGILDKFNQLHGQPEADAGPEDAGVIGFVKYDPSAAQHIYTNGLFFASVLKAMLQDNAIANIPDFPNSGVVLKPVFTALGPKTIDPKTGMHTMPVWPGDGGNPNRPFGPKQWNNHVSIDLDGETNTAERIYSIKDFISFKLDSAQAASRGVKVGTMAVLQGMHVTTRETKRWTWQSFWWSENNNTPESPSSTRIAALRPSVILDRASDHYAMTIGYNMVQKAQPYNGGTGANNVSLYAYNPYLEAEFDTTTFDSGNAALREYYSEGSQKVGDTLNQYGMQTNCMSCHSQARFIPKLYDSIGHLYLTDQYVPLDADYFKNTVKLDFTWSIQGNLIDDAGNRLKLPAKGSDKNK